MSLVDQVEKAILEATRGRVGLLSIESREGEIVVQGRCPSFTCKKLAQESVLPLLGDTTLINELQVG